VGWVETYPLIVAELVRKNGSYEAKVPRMRASDMMAFAGLYTRSVISAIERSSDQIVRSDLINDEGIFSANVIAVIASFDAITATQYLSQSSPTDKPWKRTPTKLTDAQIARAHVAGIKAITYEPARSSTIVRNEQLEQLSFLRQTIADYQRALDQVVNALYLYPFSNASADICKSFLSAIRALGSDLDVLRENPPTTLAQDVSAGLGVALNRSAKAVETIGEAAGKTAAWVGDQAGKVAGATLGGFFEQATVLSILVIGAVGWIALR